MAAKKTRSRRDEGVFMGLSRGRLKDKPGL
jgi:hypothetical protein